MTAAPAYQSPEWYAERQSYIGASEMAEAVGLSPWGDPIGLWEKKTGQAPERESSFRMTLGSLTEPIIGKLASEALGVKLRRVTGPVRHPEHPFIASNPDFRIVGQRGLVQAKFRLNGEAFGDDDGTGSGESIPLHYRVQGWGELLTTGLDFVYFAVLDPFAGLSLHLIHRDAPGVSESIADLEADLVDFWRGYVETGKMPPPTAQSGEALARRFPHRVAKIGVIASAEQEQKLQELLDAREAKKAAEEREAELTNIVKAMIGEKGFVEGAGARFSWGETTRKTVAWKEIAASYRKALDAMRRHNMSRGWTLLEDVRITEDGDPLDTIEGLYTSESTSRGPFTVAKL